LSVILGPCLFWQLLMASKQASKQLSRQTSGDDAGAAPDCATVKRRPWVYGVNDGLTTDVATDFKGGGSFRQDFKALCEASGVVPHPSMSPLALPNNEEAEEVEGGGSPVVDLDTLSLQSALLDRKALEVARVVIPTSLHLKAIRLSGCYFDPEQCSILREALIHPASSVHTFHLDWNPMDVPVDAARARALVASGDALTALDDLERDRDTAQALRVLGAFRDLLLQRAQQEAAEKAAVARAAAVARGEADPTTPDTEHKKQQSKGRRPSKVGQEEVHAEPTVTAEELQSLVTSALEKVAETAVPSAPGTANLEPLDLGAWAGAFKSRWQLPLHVTERVFALLDTSAYGTGDGCVPILRLENAFFDLPLPNVPPQPAIDGGKPSSRRPSKVPVEGDTNPEDDDALGQAFAGFVDASSVLEIVSFRSCNLGRIEMRIIGRSIKLCNHLRALNLWSNNLCDSCCPYLAEALEGNFALQCLSLGRNMITHDGLAKLCRAVGAVRIDDKKDSDGIAKIIAGQTKDRDKLLKKPEPPKKDGSGRERFAAPFQVDTLEEKTSDDGHPYWLHYRNISLKTLNLQENLITDTGVVQRLQPFGVGDLILRGTPCAASMLAAKAAAAAAAAAAEAEAAETAVNGDAESSADGTSATAPATSPAPDVGQASEAQERGSGWNLILE